MGEGRRFFGFPGKVNNLMECGETIRSKRSFFPAKSTIDDVIDRMISIMQDASALSFEKNLMV